MLRVGLSGGIGSGKSTVSARLAGLGALVIDADLIAREVVAPGTPGLVEVRDRFGPDVVDDHGALDRSALGRLVFTDPVARRDLEAMTHPLIAQRTAELLGQAPDQAIVVHDVPLLVEKALGAAYHLVVIVGVGERERMRRLVRDRGMDPDEARRRMASQVDDDARRRVADVWLDNSGTIEELTEQVDRLWTGRLVPFERNVRDAVLVRRPEALRLRAPDPTWPDQARRLIARLERALGPAALSVGHIGSTAIPAMPGMDVIDLQVVVEDLRLLGDPEVAAGLVQAGFVPAEGESWDHAHGGQEATWPKRLLGYTDPARVVHVHVRAVASPAPRLARLFRDWVSADPSVHAEYRSLKHGLVARGLSTAAYAEAKEPWFADAFVRAQEWAQRTGWDAAAHPV